MARTFFHCLVPNIDITLSVSDTFGHRLVLFGYDIPSEWCVHGPYMAQVLCCMLTIILMNHGVTHMNTHVSESESEIWTSKFSANDEVIWSHTVITESAIHRTFDVQDIESIMRNDSMSCTSMKI